MAKFFGSAIREIEICWRHCQLIGGRTRKATPTNFKRPQRPRGWRSTLANPPFGVTTPLFDIFHQTPIGPSTPNAIAMIAGQSGETQWALHPTQGAEGIVPVVADPRPFPDSNRDTFDGEAALGPGWEPEQPNGYQYPPPCQIRPIHCCANGDFRLTPAFSSKASRPRSMRTEFVASHAFQSETKRLQETLFQYHLLRHFIDEPYELGI